ncbi:MAG: hypothetical protein ACJA0T_001585 [Colwellia sp.]
MDNLKVNEKEILSLFEQWNEALQTRIPKNVAALYEYDAILLPTISNTVCQSHEKIEEYFDNFLSLEPTGKIDESTVRIFGSTAMNSGTCTCTFTFKSSEPIQARFTFIYRWNGEKWMIMTHHSSQMPE